MIQSTANSEEFSRAVNQMFTEVDLLRVAVERTPVFDASGSLDAAASVRALREELERTRSAMAEVSEHREMAEQWLLLTNRGKDLVLTLDEMEEAAKKWGQIDFGKGLPEDVARLSAALGLMSDAEAEVAIQTFKLEDSLAKLSGTAAWEDLDTEQKSAALFALSQG